MKIKKRTHKIDPKTKQHIELETVIESRKPGCKIPLIQGCLIPIIFLALVVASIKTCRTENIKLEQEKIKLEHLKDSIANQQQSIIKYNQR